MLEKGTEMEYFMMAGGCTHILISRAFFAQAETSPGFLIPIRDRLCGCYFLISGAIFLVASGGSLLTQLGGYGA
jgi:hypothetical protein